MSYLFLLYLGDITSNIQSIIIFIAVVLTVGSIIWYAIQADNTYGQEWEETGPVLRKLVYKHAIISSVFLIIAILLPSKQFIYTAVALKAGVEITEEIRANPLVSKGFRVLEKYLDEELVEGSAK